MQKELLVSKLERILDHAKIGSVDDAEMALMRLAKEIRDSDLDIISKRTVTKLRDGSFITKPEGGPATDKEIRAWLRYEVFGVRTLG